MPDEITNEASEIIDKINKNIGIELKWAEFSKTMTRLYYSYFINNEEEIIKKTMNNLLLSLEIFNKNKEEDTYIIERSE